VDADDLAAILSSVRDFVRTEVVPLEARIDAEDQVPDGVVAACRAMGLYGFAIPEEFGGLGMTLEEEAHLAFELGWTTPALRSLFGTNNGIAGQVLVRGGTDEQRRAWLPRLASGEVTASFALTEADAGSDPSSLATRARRDGTDWVLDGAKRYITNAPIADVFVVFARTDPDAAGSRGISAFLVPAGTPGVSVGPRDHKMGQAGAWTADVHLDGARVPADALVGGADGLHRGFATAAGCLAHGRAHIAALCVGMAGRLVHETVEFARDRRQGGRPIAAFQLV
jgi:acyl-CoA dehydrogenase